MKSKLLMAVMLAATQFCVAAEITTFDYPRQVRYTPGDVLRDPHRNPDYVVRVRPPSGTWRDLYEHRVEVDWNTPQSATLVRFDFEGKVELAIQRSYAGLSKVAVRPAHLGIQPRIEDDTVYIMLDKPANLSVEFDGDKHHNLHVFAGAIDREKKPAGANVVVFGPGVHKPPNGAKVFSFASGQTVLIDGAAVFDAGISLDNVHDVTIRGHGIIERPGGDVRMTNSASHDNTPEAHIDGSAAIGIRHVLEINETQPRFQGVMAINSNNSTVVRNILFEDIRVDHMVEGKLFNFAVIGDDRFSMSPV